MNPDSLEKQTTEVKDPIKEKRKMRQIIIETDGNKVQVIKAEISGKIEFVGILQTVLNNVDSVII